MKKFVSGLIIGILISLSITTYAAVELNIIPNPYTVLIDGKVADVQGYNINGSTYLKLTDFVEAGLGIKFNKDTEQIEITTPSVSTEESKKNALTLAEQKSVKSTPKIDSDGSILFDPDKDLIGTNKNTTIDNINVYKHNNEKFVFFGDIGVILKNTNMRLSSNSKTHIATLIDWSGDSDKNINPTKLRQIKINSVTLGSKGIYDDLFFTYDDWINKIKPFIKEGI